MATANIPVYAAYADLAATLGRVAYELDVVDLVLLAGLMMP